jgi:hypothetical protein
MDNKKGKYRCNIRTTHSTVPNFRPPKPECPLLPNPEELRVL